MRYTSLLPATVAYAATTHSSSLNCTDIVIPVAAYAQNLQLPSNLTVAGLTPAFAASVPTLPTTQVGGTYKIAVRYCPPTKPQASRAQTLQILVPGLTYNSDYWSGLGPPGTRPGQDYYSYVEYAATDGFPPCPSIVSATATRRGPTASPPASYHSRPRPSTRSCWPPGRASCRA